MVDNSDIIPILVKALTPVAEKYSTDNFKVDPNRLFWTVFDTSGRSTPHASEEFQIEDAATRNTLYNETEEIIKSTLDGMRRDVQ